MADDIIERLDRIEANMAELRADMATVAKNVDVTRLGEWLQQAIRGTNDLRALHNLQYQMLQMQLQPLSGVPGMLRDIVTLLQRLVDRVEALETPPAEA